MKKCLIVTLTLAVLLGFGTVAGATTLKVGLDADPVSLDPQVQLSGGMLQLSHWLFDPLVRWTQEMTFEPRLATRWERLDELTMRFYLREGVKFHSGNPFTANDVKWSFDRMRKSADFKGLLEPFDGCFHR
jgi:peptide/nickel transport system substrate-binding protein